MRISKYIAVFTAATLVAAVSAQAETFKFVPASGNLSDSNSWFGATSGFKVPGSTDEAAFANPDVGQGNQTVNVDVNHTVQKLTTTFAAQDVTNTVSGPGTLTIDGGGNWAVGVANQAGGAGGRLNIAGNVELNNAAGVTDIRSANSSGNVLEFTPTSTLTLTTVGVTLNFGSGGQIEFNGAINGAANLMIQCDNVSFNGDSSAHTGSILMNSSSAFLAVNGGTLGNSGTALVGNYGSNEVELNAADVINGMNIKSYGTFLLDVNAGQDDMGVIQEVNANGLTIDISDLGAGEELWFADNSGASSGWYGTMAIVGFEEGKIRFGTDANGLTVDQLAIISDDTYGLTDTGYLTVVPEPATIGLFAISALVFAVKRMDR